MTDHMIERTFGGGTHRTVALLEGNPWTDSSRFLALEQESARLLDLAIEETNPVEELRLIREARRLRAEMGR